MGRRGKGPRLRFIKKPGWREGSWYIESTEGGRTKQRSCSTGDRGPAETQLAEFILDRCRRAGPRDPSQFPIAEALADYSREHAPRTAAPERVAYAVDALAGFWAANMAGDITRETCAGYGRHRGKADGTVRRELGVLRAALNHVHHEGRLTRVPFVFLPSPTPAKDRWLTRSDAAALLRAARRDKRCRLHLPLFILLALYTGARKGAVLSLRAPQVDLARGRIDFNPPGKRRTAKGRPIIPIPRRLAGFLRSALERAGQLGYVVNIDGERVKDIKKGFATAAIRAGLFEAIEVKREGKAVVIKRAIVSPHVLRHTAGTWMAQRGVPLWEIAGYLGHGQERTSELYAHHHPDFLASAKRAMDRPR